MKNLKICLSYVKFEFWVKLKWSLLLDKDDLDVIQDSLGKIFELSFKHR